MAFACVLIVKIVDGQFESERMLFAMQAPEPSWSKILAAILGVLGFVLSCYN